VRRINLLCKTARRMILSLVCRLVPLGITLALACPLMAGDRGADQSGVWPVDVLAGTIDLPALEAEPQAAADICLLGGEILGEEPIDIVPIGGHPGYPAFPPCFCADWAPWYLGVEGGWAFGLNETPDSPGVGGNFNGTAFGTQLTDGWAINVRVGRRFSPRWRADFSYSQMHGSYNWETFFPGFADPSGFRSEVTSHLLLVSGYWHFWPPAERTRGLRIDPYVGAGIGVAFNKLYDTDEFTLSTGQVYAKVFSDTTSSFAARFTFGTHWWLTPNLALDFAFATSYVGDIQSDDFRNFGGVQPIGRYDFHDNWIGTATLGLIWFPQPGFLRR